MSFWEFNAAVEGYRRANSADEDEGLSAHEAELLGERLNRPPVWQ